MTKGTGVLRFIETLDAQDRTKKAMYTFLNEMARGRDINGAAETAGITRTTYTKWRSKYPPFQAQADMFVKANRIRRSGEQESNTMARKGAKGLIFNPDREMPEKPGLEEFRWRYFGRPSIYAHQLAIKAMEDRTNMRTFIFLPTGTGKDTLAGDAVAWLKADDSGSNRVAWFMEREEFSARRMLRLDKYLTDHRQYRVAPEETPGSQVPSADLIEDFGPFRWQKGMVYPDGTAVPKPKWTQQTRYFLGSDVNEADPDLWATGMDGSLYGSRIRTAVLSDPFVPENQKNPNIRAAQLSTIRTVLRTRMDSRGQIWVLGTMLPVENNYEALMDEWIPDGTEIVWQSDDGMYVKYRNRVAVVRHPAILDQGTDRERSFWQERFPLKTIYRVPDGTFDEETDQKNHIDLDEETLTIDQINEFSLMGDDVEVIEGLVDLRGAPGTEQWNSFQATHQQKRIPKHTQVDFSDEVLAICDDPSRTYGQAESDEVFVVGVDPAKKYGAGLIVWAVSRRRGTMTVVEAEAHSELGTTGIKNELVVQPLSRWRPIWLCYEINKHEAVLDDSIVQTQVKSLGVRVHRFSTFTANRNSATVGPASLADYMRSGVIKFPTGDHASDVKTKLLKDHFQAFEIHDLSRGLGRTSRPGEPGHQPDDMCVAAWVGFDKAREILEQGVRRKVGHRAMHVPRDVLRRWNPFASPTPVDNSDRQPYMSAAEIITMGIEYASND